MTNVYEKIMMTIFKIGDIFNRPSLGPPDVMLKMSHQHLKLVTSVSNIHLTDRSFLFQHQQVVRAHHIITVPTPIISHFEKLSPTCISKSAIMMVKEYETCMLVFSPTYIKGFTNILRLNSENFQIFNLRHFLLEFNYFREINN